MLRDDAVQDMSLWGASFRGQPEGRTFSRSMVGCERDQCMSFGSVVGSAVEWYKLSPVGCSICGGGAQVYPQPRRALNLVIYHNGDFLISAPD